jgi:DNA modification methylase
LLQEARNYFQEGNLSNSAKKLRQLARTIKEIQFSIEQKGNYHEKNSLNDLTGKEWLRHTKSWFIVDGKPSDFDKSIQNHPGSFPPAVAKHFINFFTKTGEWVVDPFMGIGSTVQACKDLNRNCWGIELNENYADYSNRRVSNYKSSLNEEQKVQNVLRVINADARQIQKIWQQNKFPKAKLLITSPPYWNMLEQSRGGVESTMKKRVKEGLDQTYSSNENDFGNIEHYDTYIEELVTIFVKASKILIDKAYIVIILQNIRQKNGIMKPVAWDVAKRLSDDFLLRQEFIWLQDQKFMGIWGYPSQYVSNVHHHYCLVFQKKKN